MITFRAGPTEPLKNEEIDALFANIDLLLDNADKILGNEKYRNIHVKGIAIDGIYMGHVTLFLGDLIALWQNNQWRDGQKFYYHLGGSPLSGMSYCTYYQNGKSGCDRNRPSFMTLLKPADMVIKNLQEPPSGVTLPFPNRKSSDLNIYDLIEQLKS